MKVQVKALSKINALPIGASLDKIMGDFWVVVINVAQEEPCAFVMLPSEVKEGAHRREKDGRVSYWLEIAAYDRDVFREKWDRIGRGDDAVS
ncbi:MAG: hypothetical protein M0Q43_11705 [Methanothrix sp.]|nr:hypothetical protein [Methanothrix sp.]